MLLQEMRACNKMNGSLPGWVNEDTGEHARCWTRRSTVLKLCLCVCVCLQFTVHRDNSLVPKKGGKDVLGRDVDVTED